MRYLLPKRVLVTGGAGFIGSHVAEALLGRGHDVAVLDTLRSGHDANVPARAALYRADITDAAAVARVFADVRPEWVSHHAAQISIAASMRDPVEDARVNVLGSLVLLEASRRAGVERFVFASTGGALYGDPSHSPCDESTPLRPVSPYGTAKAAVESYLALYRTTWRLPNVALRYANVYGPRQSPGGEAGVVAIFAARMLQGVAPTIFGDGEQQRDFVYVTDVAEANALAFERALDGSYNVGTGVPTSVNQVVRLLAAECQFTGAPVHEAARPGEVRRIALDARRLEQAAGWRPRVTLEEGLRRVVQHVRQAA